jgi:hypothetical protein
MNDDLEVKKLTQLKNLNVDQLQMQRWKNAVQKELKNRTTSRIRYELVAAVALGVMLGAAASHLFATKQRHPIQELAATFERSHANLDQEDLL